MREIVISPEHEARVAYLAPELPALSATFVYEELLAVERRGLKVIPISVRRPTAQAVGQEGLSERTRILYAGSVLSMIMHSVKLIPTFKGRTWIALKWLASDILSVKPWRGAAWKLVFQWLAGARLAEILRQEQCFHLHIHFSNTPAQIGMYASAFSGVPFTVTAHANDIFERGLLMPRKAKRAAKLLTISQFNKEYLSSHGVPTEQIDVVRCGVTFVPRQLPRRFATEPPYRVGTLCRLVEKKGVDDLLRAVASLNDGPGIEVSVAGDGPLRSSLESLAESLGIRPRVHFEGAMSHGQVVEWMQTLDALVLACKVDARGDMDGIPVALMEAMSQCVPVLSTRLSGIPELVIQDETGLLATPSDPDSIADLLKALLGNAALCERLTEAGQRHVQREFGQDLNIDRLLAHFVRATTLAQPP